MIVSSNTSSIPSAIKCDTMWRRSSKLESHIYRLLSPHCRRFWSIRGNRGLIPFPHQEKRWGQGGAGVRVGAVGILLIFRDVIDFRYIRILIGSERSFNFIKKTPQHLSFIFFASNSAGEFKLWIFNWSALTDLWTWQKPPTTHPTFM